MKSLLKPFLSIAKVAERFIDAVTDYRFFGTRDDWKIGIRTYATYGLSDRVCFRGRVLRDHSLVQPTIEDRWYQNLIRTFHALESDEVSGVVVELTFCGNRRIVQSDKEGYIDEIFDVDDADLPYGWHSVSAKIVEVPYGKFDDQLFESRCLIPNPQSRFGIISDIDDTVLDSAVTSPLKLMSLLMFGNWLRRAAVEGTPDLYQSLVKGPTGNDHNPVFYVSSSPWNLEPVLTAFMKRVGLPAGPMMLRDLGIGRDADLGLSHGHKEVKIAHLLETYPKMRFVLLGDAGQEDAAIYARICERFGDQVIVAYIRQVGSMPSDRVVRAVAHENDSGTPIYLLPGSKSITGDAIKRGLIRDDAEVASGNASDGHEDEGGPEPAQAGQSTFV